MEMKKGQSQTPSDDYTIDQRWENYTQENHQIWQTLFNNLKHVLPNRACNEFVDGINGLGVVADHIPDFRRLNDVLEKATGWQIVAVPGLVPDDIFFEHLANKRFPSTCFIRTPEQLNYIQEPDIFHDIFGHVPLLMNPIFANYMEQYGKGGLKALKLNSLKNLARLYWYTVEFGLINTDDGLRIYGSGIVSSKGEVIYSLEDKTPNRVEFDLIRIMRTNYRIDDYQEIYFVINSFEELFDATLADFTKYYEELKQLDDLMPGDLLQEDHKIAI